MNERSSLFDKKFIIYGKNTIEFFLAFSKRKTMEIAVHPDSTIIVKVPINTEIALIEKKVLKRARWILKQLKYFKQFNPKTPKKFYVNGESHLYLGKKYRLKITEGKKNSIKLLRGHFFMTIKNKSTSTVPKEILDSWYIKKASIQFVASIERCWPRFIEYGFTKPKLTIKNMKKRWGSLSNKGTITLNTELIKAPKECIDYVVIHELCHLIYTNHSIDFYNLLDSILPDWEKIKHKLELSLC